ncbi:MAG: Multi-sensor hybrid histidine kinase [Gammaproteobacteria bacterium]|nr:Multi-sensor hybrid histidine kinase [Gammaproteobacteria bacterium]
MGADDKEEEEQLRSVALQNAKSILRARQQAERELIATKDALELRTQELSRALAAQKEIESELRQQREWFRVTLSSIGDAVITTDMRGNVTFLNPVAEAMTGWSSVDAHGVALEHVFTIVNEKTRQRVQNPVEKVLREGLIVGLANHTALIARDGTEIAIEDSAAPIRDSNGNISGAVMVFHDVSARRRAEADSERLYKAAQIEIANRESADAALRDADRRKDEFLATLAHELRNPLAPIRQAALVSKAPGATEAQKRWSHDVIDRQVQHMSLLLDDLLDISRVTRGRLALRMQATDLASVIEVAVETARPALDGKRHVLSVELPSEPVRFTADPLRVAQVLSNLLTNAAKYTDPEGQIRLTAACDSDDVVIRVADSGIGISAAALPRVFNMFSQVHSATDRSEGGLGIGLALARGLIDLHEGKLEASSAGLGCGSEFTVRLPRRPVMEAQHDESNTRATSTEIRCYRILIADDNRDSAETLAALLRMDGHEVTTVHDGPVALSAFGELKPQVALLDIGMPGLTGYEVARKMRQAASGASLTLIAITGWGQDVDKERAVAAGFDHHLTKPVDPRRLADMLRF